MASLYLHPQAETERQGGGGLAADFGWRHREPIASGQLVTGLVAVGEWVGGFQGNGGHPEGQQRHQHPATDPKSPAVATTSRDGSGADFVKDRGDRSRLNEVPEPLSD
jgi:hypothetical protein